MNNNRDVVIPPRYVNRERLRPAHSPEELAQIYAKPHNISSHQDHKIRADVTVSLIEGTEAIWGDGQWWENDAITVADLSCGEGYIANGIHHTEDVHLGDIAGDYPFHGPIEEMLPALEPVDLYICTETMEHLDDPDAVLKLIRPKTKWMVLSTPIDAWRDPNREHYWAWGRRGVERMMAVAGFQVVTFMELDFRPQGHWYSFGIWLVR